MYLLRVSAASAATFFLLACVGQSPEAPPPRPAPSPSPKAVGMVLQSVHAAGATADLQVLRAGAADWTPIATDAAVYAKDKIQSGPADSAALRLTDTLDVSLNADSLFQVLSPSNLKLEKGELWVDAKGPAVVETPKGKVSIESGKGGIRFKNDTLTVSWLGGKARLEGEGGAVSLSGGDEAAADAAGVRRTVIKDPSALVAWTQKVRQAIQAGSSDETATLAPPTAGLGTLTARLPGGSKPLPFQILAEDIHVRIQDNMAVTRIEQVFLNPTHQVVEGEYRFPIPENASLTGYDMEINGRLMRGEIVERERGRKIMKKVIDDYVYQMRDPALTEWESGSTFKTRIFPIGPKEQKRIVLTHLMPLSGAAGAYRYVLPVSMGAVDSPSIPKFRIQAEVSSGGGAPMVETPLYAARIEPTGQSVTALFEADNFIPRADFVLTVHTNAPDEVAFSTYGNGSAAGKDSGPLQAEDGIAAQPFALVQGEDNVFLLRLTPNLGRLDAALDSGSDWLFLVDTSESRFGPDMEVQKRLLNAVVDTLGPDDRVKVIGFDTFPQRMDVAWAVPSVSLKTRIASFLAQVEPGGATNLEGALRAAQAEMEAGRSLKVVLIGDGAATLGETAPKRLVEIAEALFPYPSSFSAVGIGAGVDRLLLESLTTRTRGRYFSLSGGEDLFAAAVRIALGLRGPVLEAPQLSFNGVTVLDVVPERLPNLQSGGELLAAGRYRGTGKLNVALFGTLDQKPWRKEWTFDVGSGSAKNTFVPLVWAAEKIDALTLADTDAARKELISISKKFGLATRLTSFIVLENNAMYREFNVARSPDRKVWDGGEVEYTLPESSFMPESTFDDADAASDVTAEREPSRAASGAGTSRSAASAPKRAASAGKSSVAKGTPWDRNDELAGMPSQLVDKPMMVPNESGSSDYHYYRRYRPRPQYQVSVHPLAGDISPSAVEKAGDFVSKVQAAPLDRRARRNLVNHLIQNALLDDAARALSEWSAIDRSNPEVHLFAGDLYRLQGKLPQALRAYSSVLDLQPENARVPAFLAAYFESQKRWGDALPFVTSLCNAEPKDDSHQVRRAVTALKANEPAEAARIADTLTERDAAGYPVIKKGLKLSKSERDTVLSIAMSRNLPILFESTANAGLRSPGLKVILRWEGPSRPVLWTSTARDRFLGGAFGKSRLISDASANEQVLFVTGGAEGRYRIQVLCVDPSDCKHTTGQISVESHGKKKTIPFVLEGGLGKEVAAVRVQKQDYRW